MFSPPTPHDLHGSPGIQIHNYHVPILLLASLLHRSIFLSSLKSPQGKQKQCNHRVSSMEGTGGGGGGGGEAGLPPPPQKKALQLSPSPKKNFSVIMNFTIISVYDFFYHVVNIVHYLEYCCGQYGVYNF